MKMINCIDLSDMPDGCQIDKEFQDNLLEFAKKISGDENIEKVIDIRAFKFDDFTNCSCSKYGDEQSKKNKKEVDKIHKDKMSKIKGKEYYSDLTAIMEDSLINNNTKVINSIFDNIKNFNEKELCMIVAQRFKKDGNIPRMIANYKLASNYGSVKAMIILGMHYLECKQFDESKKYLYKALKNTPKNKENKNLLAYIYNCLGQYYEKINNKDLTIEMYKKSTENNNIVSLKSLCEIYYNDNNYEQAEIYINILIEKDNFEYVNHLGLIYLKQNKKKDMIRLFKLGEEKGVKECICNMGIYYLRKKLYKKALARFLKLSDNTYPCTLTNIGACYEGLAKRHNEKREKYINLAKIYYDKGIKNKSCEALDELGRILEEDGDYEACEIYYNYGKEMNFENTDHLFARLYFKQEKYDEMIKHLEKGIEINDVYCMYEMALHQEKLGNINKMIEYLERASEEHCYSALKLCFYYLIVNNNKEKAKKYIDLLKNTFELSQEKIIMLFIKNIHCV